MAVIMAIVTSVHRKSDLEPCHNQHISLFHSARKLFERIVGEQLIDFLENTWTPQNGIIFKKSCSAFDLQTILLSKLCLGAFEDYRPSLTTSFDIASVYVFAEGCWFNLDQLGVI